MMSYGVVFTVTLDATDVQSARDVAHKLADDILAHPDVTSVRGSTVGATTPALDDYGCLHMVDGKPCGYCMNCGYGGRGPIT